jgi:hypothetical protein
MATVMPSPTVSDMASRRDEKCALAMVKGYGRVAFVNVVSLALCSRKVLAGFQIIVTWLENLKALPCLQEGAFVLPTIHRRGS